MNFSKPAITRLARSAGVKSVSDDCFAEIDKLISNELDEVIRLVMIVNTERQTKTVMPDDVYEAIQFRGLNLAQSTEIGTNTYNK